MLILITDRRSFGKELGTCLRQSGIFLVQCPTETAQFTCERYDTGGVLLDTVGAPAAETLCNRLRLTYPELPIAAIIPNGQRTDLQIERILYEDGSLDRLAQQAIRFYKADCGWCSSPLSLYRLTVGQDRRDTVYMGYPLTLTSTEHLLLRYLLYRMPQITEANELLAVCFADGTQKKANLNVHIANINRKAAAIHPSPLVVNVYGKGYRLRDGLN